MSFGAVNRGFTFRGDFLTKYISKREGNQKPVGLTILKPTRGREIASKVYLGMNGSNLVAESAHGRFVCPLGFNGSLFISGRHFDLDQAILQSARLTKGSRSEYLKLNRGVEMRSQQDDLGVSG